MSQHVPRGGDKNKRREKYKALREQEALEIHAIYEKYKPKFKKIKHTFTKKELENNNWYKSGSDFRGEIWRKNEEPHESGYIPRVEILIFIDATVISEIATQSGCTQQPILDMDELEYYFKHRHPY